MGAMITGVQAQATVTDLGRAESWYTSVLGSAPDSRPMDGLLEWHLGGGFGVQVWSEPDRAGHSSMILIDDALDDTAARLSAAGIEHGAPQPGGGQRVLQLSDPDGNRIVFTGA